MSVLLPDGSGQTHATLFTILLNWLSIADAGRTPAIKYSTTPVVAAAGDYEMGRARRRPVLAVGINQRRPPTHPGRSTVPRQQSIQERHCKLAPNSITASVAVISTGVFRRPLPPHALLPRRGRHFSPHILRRTSRKTTFSRFTVRLNLSEQSANDRPLSLPRVKRYLAVFRDGHHLVVFKPRDCRHCPLSVLTDATNVLCRH